jgi:hypothetical protein
VLKVFQDFPKEYLLNMLAPAAKNRSRTATAPAFGVPFEDKIRSRAYQLYEERGREDGHAMEDWLRAKAEITSNKARIHVAYGLKERFPLASARASTTRFEW